MDDDRDATSSQRFPHQHIVPLSTYGACMIHLDVYLLGTCENSSPMFTFSLLHSHEWILGPSRMTLLIIHCLLTHVRVFCMIDGVS
jgi:hypothetical protein